MSPAGTLAMAATNTSPRPWLSAPRPVFGGGLCRPLPAKGSRLSRSRPLSAAPRRASIGANQTGGTQSAAAEGGSAMSEYNLKIKRWERDGDVRYYLDGRFVDHRSKW